MTLGDWKPRGISEKSLKLGSEAPTIYEACPSVATASGSPFAGGGIASGLRSHRRRRAGTVFCGHRSDLGPLESAAHHVSTNGRLGGRAARSVEADWAPLTSHRRVSAGSITASISRYLAAERAFPFS